MSRLTFALRGIGVLVLLAVAGACSGSQGRQAPPQARAGGMAAAAPTGRATADDRVRSFVGRVPPDVFTDGQWVGPAGSTSLAALRGRAVYLQFAFPQ